MAVPDYQSLMMPVLNCLGDKQEWNVPACSEKIANALNLSSEDRETMLPSGTQLMLNNRIGWAISYMQRAGLIARTRRAYYSITERGLSVLSKKPALINVGYLRQFPEFVEWQTLGSKTNEGNISASVVEITDSIISPEEHIAKAHTILENELKSQIIDYLTSDLVSPSAFENIIVDLLIAMGYGGGRAEMGKSLGRSGDKGVDGVINEDSLGLDVVYMQAKKYKRENVVGRPDVQSFVGSLEGFRATKGVFVTTSSFTDKAEEYASMVHKRIVLIDGVRLSELMIKHNIGVRSKDTYNVKKLDEEYFSE